MKKHIEAHEVLKRLDAATKTRQRNRHQNTRIITLGPNAAGTRGHEHTHTKDGVDAIDSVLDEAAVALTTRGDIMTMGASDLDRIAIGTADFYFKSDGTDAGWARIMADEVEVDELGTATYDDMQDYINFFGDRTLFSGGTISATAPADGTVAIAACTAWAKESNSDTAVGTFFDYAGTTGLALTDLVTNIIYLDYNGGTPQVVVATSPLTYGFQQDHVLLGVVFRNGTATTIVQADNLGVGRMGRAHMQHVEHGADRTSGLVTSSVGTRNLSVTQGVLHLGMIRKTPSAIDTSVAGTFSYWYTSDSGSTWTEVTSATQISRTQYNNIAAGLASLGTNKYGVHWVYMDFGGNLHVVYGQGNYNANQAEVATIPSVLPNVVITFSILIAKIICQEGTDTLTITYPWTEAFASSLATDHGSLAGLTDDDHAQYIKDTEFTAAEDVLVGTGAGTFAAVPVQTNCKILAYLGV